ncbi:MAG TPA: hypothetical protein VK625_11610 [Flavitalea sp.]|nr:hypothetical protein [Flavitalea sp.]
MRYFKYFLLVLITGIGFLDLTYVLFRRGYNKFNSFEQTRLREIISGKENYAVLFLGSSRTFHHVNPKIIDSSLKINSYNAGIDGANIAEVALVLKCYLASHPKPKVIVADISTPFFDIKENPLFNSNIYYPFLNNEIVYNTMKPFKRVGLLRFFPFLQIPECDDFLREGAVQGLLGKEKRLEPHYKGHLESGKDTIPLPFKVKYLTTDYPVSGKGTTYLYEIIKICKDNNIQLLLTYSPVYKLKDEKLNPDFFPTIIRIADSSGVQFLNYRKIPLTYNNKLFRDELHLNTYGANIFSAILANDLKSRIDMALLQ